MKKHLRTLAGEPLAHFAALGVTLYFGYGLVAPPPESTVVVPATVVEALVAEHTARAGEPPTATQRDGLVQQWIDDELLIREARALGLDRSDPVIRRRLRQLGEMLVDAAPAVPGEAELDAWIAARPQRYPATTRLTFEQRYFSSLREGRARAEASLQTSEPAGEPFAHGERFAGMLPARIDALFGPGFAAELAALPTGMWAGPFPSRLGWHLVRVESRERIQASNGHLRARARADWQLERRTKSRQEALASLRRRYEVPPEATQP